MISLDKTYRTVGGRAVRLYTLNGEGYFPVVGQAQLSGDVWGPRAWPADGFTPATPEMALVEVHPQVTTFLGLYDGFQRLGSEWPTKAQANADPDVVLKITRQNNNLIKVELA